MDKRTKKKLEKKAITRLPPGAKLLTEKQGMALTFLVESEYRRITTEENKKTCGTCRFCRPKENEFSNPKCYETSLAPFFFETREGSTCNKWRSETWEQ